MTGTTTRRALPGGAGLAAVAGLTQCGGNLAHAATATGTVNPRLLRLIALRDRAEAECDRFDADIEMPARQACRAALEAYQHEPAPPHRESATTFINIDGDSVRLTTAKPGSIAVARRVVGDPNWADMGDEIWRQAHRELATLADERDAIVAGQKARHRAFENETRARFRIEAMQQRSSDLGARECRLRDAAITLPATSIADVLVKLDLAGRSGRDRDDGFVLASITTDLRRMAGVR